MLVFSSDRFPLPLPPGHRFPARKYVLLRERVLEAPWAGEGRLRVPQPASYEELLTVHSPAYLAKVTGGRLEPAEIRRMGFPWSPELVERSRRSVGGTLEAARSALEWGVGVNLSGGTHHAFPDRGEGFCVFNDTAVAARVLQREGRVRRVVILDLDVHQGNGTAFVFRRDPTVFTLSVHGANNYPFRKEPSHLDVELPDGCGDEEYLEAMGPAVDAALERSRPDLAFFIAGADPYVGDRLGRLALTKEGLAERDRRVLERCRALGIPVAVVMGGGYAQPVEDTVDIHFRTVQLALAPGGS